MPSPSALSKKTKTEILEEYQKLQDRLEEANQTARIAFAPSSIDAVTKAQTLSPDAVRSAILKTKAAVNANLNDLVSTIADHLQKISEHVMENVQQFQGLQDAISASRDMLATHYNIQVAAETLHQLITTYEEKKQQTETDLSRRRQEVEEEIAKRKRDGDRTTEEQEYDLSLKRRRSLDEFEQEKNRREKELAERELNLKNQELEIAQLRQETQQIDNRIVAALKEQEQKLTDALTTQWKTKFDLAAKDWDGQKRLLEMERKNFDERIKELESERGLLKKELEMAAKKAQELAVKIIEGNTREAISASPIPNTTSAMPKAL